ncbi:MAG: glycoside hydrolase family 9 protein [Prevotella sp.]|nr:glycoside hydrolase family 9 protein [Prevotella sp.]
MHQANGQEIIRLNQVGVYPGQEKVVVLEGTSKKVSVKNSRGKKAGKVKVLRTARSPWSGKQRTVVSISGLTQAGDYTVTSGADKATLTVKPSALRDITAGSLKAFYYQRTAMPIEQRYAGQWNRPAGHMDNEVYIHPSAVSPGRPAGSVISSPWGWYDAGDYNKYIVNSAFSIGIMLCSYEQNKAYFDQLNADIPESQNQTADLLDEIMYNLKWMLTMQDPWDGGVYHKLTTPNFEGFVKPGDCHQKRYVVQKSVTASYDFAAVMAQAARVFKGNKDYPDFSAQAERAAMAAFKWAEENPTAFYNQDAMNKKFDPDVSTGTYGDGFAGDERFWAATELYIQTQDPYFLDIATKTAPQRFSLPTWGGLASLGTYEWMASSLGDKLNLTPQLMAYADSIVKTTATSCYQTPNGNSPRDFGWGCLAENFCASGVTLLYAYRHTGDAKYLTAAQQNVDYLLGRNPTGFCYVTGYGSKSPMHPHHRLSASDGIEAPVPGLLVGGPNPGQQDLGSGLKYPSKHPDESYLDEEPSYASNEIAINWNASLVAMLGWIDAESK